MTCLKFLSEKILEIVLKPLLVSRLELIKNKQISRKNLKNIALNCMWLKFWFSDRENFSGLICLQIIDLFLFFLYTVLLLSHFLLNWDPTLTKKRIRRLLCPEDLHSHPKTFQDQLREIINFFTEVSRIKGSEGSNEIKNSF